MRSPQTPDIELLNQPVGAGQIRQDTIIYSIVGLKLTGAKGSGAAHCNLGGKEGFWAIWHQALEGCHGRGWNTAQSLRYMAVCLPCTKGMSCLNLNAAFMFAQHCYPSGILTSTSCSSGHTSSAPPPFVFICLCCLRAILRCTTAGSKFLSVLQKARSQAQQTGEAAATEAMQSWSRWQQYSQRPTTQPPGIMALPRAAQDLSGGCVQLLIWLFDLIESLDKSTCPCVNSSCLGCCR